MASERADTRYQRLPKVELHVHLEGAIPHSALWDLMEKYGGDPDVHSLEDLKERFRYKDFEQFIETWSWKNQFLREYEDFRHIAAAVGADLQGQNILYAELFYSPSLFGRYGLETGKLTEAVRSGLSEVDGTEIALVADLVRDYGPERELTTLEELADVQEHGVVGIGIGGTEPMYPPEPFAQLFERARQLGFHTNAHAGEAAGPESIWGAIRALQVERIGHGTRAEEDPALVESLAERRLPLEMCPLSNCCTNTVSSHADHPIRRYHDAGIPVTVNTDDPRMFGNSLALELQALVDSHHFMPEELHELTLNAIDASWASEEKKKDLVQRVLAEAETT